jgi:leader peptidase (prepilin peptidase)/N-methyltransferase
LTFWIKVIGSGICFLFGSLVGSFLNVCIWRLPRGESIVKPASRCPRCHSRIAPWDNVPLISYLLLRGRCRSCGERISARYPAVEALTGGLAALLFIVFGPSVQAAMLFILICFLIVATFTDLDRMIIPDWVTLPGILLGLMIHVLVSPGDIWRFLLGAVVGGAALFLVAFLGELIFKKESMGGGDLKLAALVGAFLGWQSVLLSLFAAVLVGALTGLTLIIIGLKERQQYIPFGPFIAIGTVVVIFWGGDVIRAYTNLVLL